MLLIMAQHFLSDEEPLALVVSPIILKGLLFLLRRADLNAGECSSLNFPSSILQEVSAVRLVISLDNEFMRRSTKNTR